MLLNDLVKGRALQKEKNFNNRIKVIQSKSQDYLRKKKGNLESKI